MIALYDHQKKEVVNKAKFYFLSGRMVYLKQTTEQKHNNDFEEFISTNYLKNTSKDETIIQSVLKEFL